MSAFTFRRATESDRTYLQRLNYLADVFGDESAELGEDALEQILAGGAGSNVDMAFTARHERARRDGAVAEPPVQSALGL